MAFFGNNENAILNNLYILNKLYYVVIFIESINQTNLPNNEISIEIFLKGNAINRNSETSTASANISGTSNTTNGISNFYVLLLNKCIDLLYSNFSSIKGFANCDNTTSFTNYNILNNINQSSTSTMNFKFDILDLKINRQEEQTVNAFIEYQYINYYTNFNYKPLRQYIIDVLESDLDINAYWEYIEIYIAHNALQKFKDIIGIKIQFVVNDNPTGTNPEPGNHGPIYTYGLIQ